jgi:hypothetical protein
MQDEDSPRDLKRGCQYPEASRVKNTDHDFAKQRHLRVELTYLLGLSP